MAKKKRFRVSVDVLLYTTDGENSKAVEQEVRDVLRTVGKGSMLVDEYIHAKDLKKDLT